MAGGGTSATRGRRRAIFLGSLDSVENGNCHLNILLEPCPHFIVITCHHEVKPIGFEKEKNHADVARDSKFKNISAQTAQAQPGMTVRFPKVFDQLVEALIDFFQLPIATVSRPAPPTGPKFNREGSRRCHPMLSSFHVWPGV